MPDLLTRDSIETTEPVTRIRRSRTWTVGTSGFMFIAPTTLDGEWILDPAWGPRVAIASEISVTEPAQRPGLVPDKVQPEPSDENDAVLFAVGDLQSILRLNTEQVSQIGGFSRRNISNWVRGTATPHRSTVNHLMAVHSLVRASHRAIGAGFTAWLHDQIPAGEDLVSHLSTPEGLAAVTREARSLMFTVPAQDDPGRDLDFEALRDPLVEPNAEPVRQTIRRLRRSAR